MIFPRSTWMSDCDDDGDEDADGDGGEELDDEPAF